MKDRPEIIKEIWVDFDWNNKKVWRLDLPTELINIELLEWHFSYPFWVKPGCGFFTLTPQEVMDNPQTYSAEYERVMNSDISYSLNIIWWKNKWIILDGIHRLLKAKLEGRNKIGVRKVTLDLIPSIEK